MEKKKKPKIKKVPKKEKKKEAHKEVLVSAPAAVKAVESVSETPVVEKTTEEQELEQQFAKGMENSKPERYWEAVGRRKTAVARVRLYTRGEKAITVNEKPYGNYFPTKEQQKIAEESLQKMKSVNRFRVSARVSGGGLKAQAEAVRHGIARALVAFNPDFRKRLRRAGFLTRDPRMKERKKFGLKSARRRPQWAKR